MIAKWKKYDADECFRNAVMFSDYVNRCTRSFFSIEYYFLGYMFFFFCENVCKNSDLRHFSVAIDCINTIKNK